MRHKGAGSLLLTVGSKDPTPVVRLGSRCLRAPLVGAPLVLLSENLLTTTRISLASGYIRISALHRLLLTVHRILAVECIGKRNPG